MTAPTITVRRPGQQPAALGLSMTASAVKQRARTRLKAQGRWEPTFIDAGPARAHVHLLRAAGMGPRTIAARAGVSKRVVDLLCWDMRGRGQSARIFRDNADRLLALRPDLHHLAPGARVDAAPYVRRMRALAAVGWSITWQSRQLGLGWPVTLAGGITVRNARLLVRLYDRMQHEEGPCGRSRAHAAKHGWAPPGWYDNIDTGTGGAPLLDGDDLAAELHLMLAERHLTYPDALHALGLPADHPAAKTVRVDLITAWTARGWSAETVAERLGITSRTVQRDRSTARAAA